VYVACAFAEEESRRTKECGIYLGSEVEGMGRGQETV